MSNEWGQLDGALSKKFTFKNFAEAFAFASRVALLAEEMNHHPKLTVAWGVCEVSLTSHDVQGVTERDFILSKKIDSILTDV
jgi:4a-hydroxytetrahydrobiopterin dehydratase